MSITFDIPCTCPATVVACPICGAENFRACAMTCLYDDETGLYWDCVDAEGCSHTALGLNMSNANAADVIEALGLEFDYCGSIEVQDLLGRTTLRAALPADEPVPTATDGNMIYCGRDEGYISERAGILTTLALRAREDGYTTISWG